MRAAESFLFVLQIFLWQLTLLSMFFASSFDSKGIKKKQCWPFKKKEKKRER